MKKLMIAVAIVCAAAMSQAAAVSWLATASSVYNGQKLYLLTSITESYASLEAFEATAIDYGTVAKSGPTAYKVSQRLTEDAAVTKSANFYLAVVDGNTIHYLNMTDTFQPMVYEPPASSPGNVTAVFANVANSTTTATIDAIPEPTSGLLLLLGVAGLALRRRRA